MKKFGILFVALALVALPALAQMPTGTASGRVVDNTGQALPGVTVTARSPFLQGERTTVTSANGDFIFPFLPPGDYTITFELAGFQTVEATVRISAGQTQRVDAQMPLATLAEEIVVTGAYETISAATQVSNTFEKDLIEKLPVARTIAAAALLSPGVTNTGPSGNITMQGALSYENLWLVNGVVVNENLRGQSLPLFIEDAIQETTVTTAGVSAEYGRFAGGVVTALTKSGGNEFSGSFRASLTNQRWEEKTPLTVALADDINTIYEATLGGRILRDRLWFFLAGRDRVTETTGQTALTNIPYPVKDEETRYEGKLTFAITPEHRVVGSYIERTTDQINNWFGTIMDTASLYDRSMPEKLIAANYSGAFTSNLFGELQYSKREFSFVNSGSRFRDLIYGTLLLDVSTGRRFWSPTFCGVCTPEERNNENILGKLTYFLSTASMGSHDIVAGFDTFNDIRSANNHQSGSDFRIYLTSIVIGDKVYARLVPNSTYLMWNPILKPTAGSDFKTNSFFINDRWRLNNNLSFNIGVRYDKNDGSDQEGKKVVKDDKISPRLGVSWDPKANGDLIVNASYAKYVMAIANNQADASSAAGNPATYTWWYTGDPVNAGCSATNPSACLPTEQVLQLFWQWFNSIGGTNNTNYRSNPSIPGGSVLISETLKSPDVDEFVIGVTKRLGNRGLVRADYIRREFGDFYAEKRDTTTGTVLLPNGISRADLGIVVNEDSILERKYSGFQVQGQYRMDRWLFGGNYTWSKAEGNWDGETGPNGPIRSGVLSYPEYFNVAWALNNGPLAIDQRHRARLYASWDVIDTRHHDFNVTLLHQFYSGTYYGAVGTISMINRNPGGGNAPYVPNTYGYINPPSTQTYWFQGRDTYKTDDIHRTDLALNYSFKFGRSYELFIQPEVLNLMNRKGVEIVDQTIQTRAQVTTLQSFNPFTETPVEGAHWQKGPNFGKPTLPSHYQTPRTFRISMGFRF
ncbi:MAG: TonB-dependent receptor [Acidobacteriota bacterium]|jgi:hypothetical protein